MGDLHIFMKISVLILFHSNPSPVLKIFKKINNNNKIVKNINNKTE